MQRFILLTLILLCLIALVPAGAYLALKTPWGAAQVEKLLEAQADIEIDGLRGSLPFAPRITRLSIHDAQGAWLVAEDIQLNWGVGFAPLTWHIKTLSARQVQVMRLPVSEDDTAESTGFALPALPRLQLHALSLPRIILDKPVLGEPALLAAHGSFTTVTSAADAAAQLRLTSVDGPAMALDITTHAGREGLRGTASLEEEAGGLIGTLTGLGEKPLSAQLPFMLGTDERLRLSDARLQWGDAALRLSGEISDVFTTPRFALSGDATPGSALPESLKSLLGTTLTYEAKGEMDGDTLDLSQLQLTGAHATLNSDGLTLAGEVISGNATLLIPEAEHLSPELRGALSADISLDGTLSEPEADVAARLSEGETTLHASAHVSFNDEAVFLEDLLATAHGVNASGDLNYLLNSGLLEGKLEVSAEDLSGLNALLATELGGRGDASITLAPQGSKQLLSAEGMLADARYGEVKAAEIVFDLRAADLFALQGLDADMKAKTITSGDIVVDNATLTAQGNTSETQWKLAANGSTPQPFDVTANGSLLLTLPDWELKIATLSGEYEATPIALAAPVTMRQQGDTLSMTELALRYGEARLQAQGSIKPNMINGQVRAENVSLTLLGITTAQGIVDATATLNGTAQAPVVAFSSTAAIRTGSGAKAETITVAAEGQLANNRLNASATMPEVEGTLRAEISLPVQFSLQPFDMAVADNAALQGAITVDAPVAALAALAIPPGHSLRGDAKGSFTLGGTVNAPQVNGGVALAEGYYENLITGTVLEDLALTLNAQPGRIVVSDARATAGEGGLSATGSVALSFALHA